MNTIEKASRDDLGRFQHHRRLLLAALITTLGAILIVGASLQREVTHDRIEAYGVILIMLGIGGRLWSILYVGGKKSAELVRTGPYSITRNPLYLFSCLAAAGAGAQMGSYVSTFGFGIICAICFYFVILREEAFLRSRLGDSYSRYLAEVPRLIPNPLLYKDQQEVTFRPRILRQTLIDGLVFFVSIPLFELIEEGQESGLIPVFFHLY